MTRFVVDGGKPQPKPEPMQPFDLRLRDVREPIAKAEAIEIPMSAWLAEDDDFADTVRIDLTELKG